MMKMKNVSSFFSLDLGINKIREKMETGCTICSSNHSFFFQGKVQLSDNSLKRMDQIEKEASQVIDEFVTNFMKTVKEFEKIHIQERLQMRKNGRMALIDISPELASVFDKQYSTVLAALGAVRSRFVIEESSSMESCSISRSNPSNAIYYRQ